MLRFLFDTDHLTLYELGHPPLQRRLQAQVPQAIGLSAITVEEALRGRLSALAQARDGPARIRRYQQLLETVRLLNRFTLVAYDQASEFQFQQLRAVRKIGTQDTKIAAVALANNLTLLTRNRRDFGRIPNLSIDDWST